MDTQAPLGEALTQNVLRFKELTEEKIRDYLPELGGNSTLKEACSYVLMSGGKRYRPSLVYMIAKALGHNTDVSFAAIAIEFFHTASLVADDLPCMDDEELRRGLPTVHRVYGDAVALLVTYTLIAAGYDCLAKSGEVLQHSNAPFAFNHEKISLLALENATKNTGIFGATGGQFLDIYPPDFTAKTLREVIEKKTVSLFEVSFVFGWLFGGGSISMLEEVKKTACHFGMAFQIADDIGDMAQDSLNGCKVNYAVALGKEEAYRAFNEEIQGYYSGLKKLGIFSDELREAGEFLEASIPRQ